MKVRRPMNPPTPEERRIKREEDYCWKQYWREKEAEEAKLQRRVQEEIEEAFKQIEESE